MREMRRPSRPRVSGWSRSVRKYVAEMAIAFRAQYFGADHAVREVALLVDVAVDRWGGETRPAAAGVEFRVGFEQRLAAAGANIGAPGFGVLVLARERPLGRLLAQHRILHRRQLLAPFGFALLNLGLCVAHDFSRCSKTERPGISPDVSRSKLARSPRTDGVTSRPPLRPSPAQAWPDSSRGNTSPYGRSSACR